LIKRSILSIPRYFRKAQTIKSRRWW
jgi:hypothetical protein